MSRREVSEGMRFLRPLICLALLLSALPVACEDPKPKASPMDRFAQCLAEKKAAMYGAVWCTHCDDQKKLFGSSWKYVPYVECSVNGTRQRTPECTRLDIRYTPTWIFADGERKVGVIPLADLGKKAGCPAP